MSDLVQFQPVRAWDRNGVFAPGAKAYFYEPGTTTPRTVYTDAALSVAHPTPVVASATGVFPPVYTSGAVKVNVTDADDVTLTGFPMDPAPTISSDSAGAGSISFDPTGNIPQDNVQEAIEAVDNNWRSTLSGYGIGTTTAATLLSNLDSTAIPSGVSYRFDMATGSGTPPSEWGASDTGNVIFFRETSDSGMMLAMSRADGKLWLRPLAAGVWGAWDRLSKYTNDQAGWDAGTDTNAAAISAAQLEATIAYRRQRFVAEDRKASGTDGGSATASTWHTRTLNTEVLNTIDGASLAADVITLPAGEYYVDATAPATAVNGHQLQLYDNDGAAGILLGRSEYANAGTGVNTTARVSGFFTLTEETDVILRHRTQSNSTTLGLGRAASSGEGEIYAHIEITRLGDYIA